MPGFAGYVALNSTLDIAILAKNASTMVPLDADSAPTYRIYSAAGLLSSGTLGNFKDTATITNAPPANPTVYTSNGHGLTVGTLVTVTGVGGNTGANTTGQVTAVTTNTFTIAVDTHLGSAYTSGGTWHTVGLYDFSFTPTSAANYASGSVYTVFVYGLFSTVSTQIDIFTFIVT